MDEEAQRIADLRKWVSARRTAADTEARLARSERPSPEDALTRGLELIAFAADLHGWPLPEDPECVRKDYAAYERWARLRRPTTKP